MLGGACVAGWSRTQKPTALSSGESEFYSATVCGCQLLWACEFFKRAGIHHDCLDTTGATGSGQGDYDRAVGRHHDKTLLIPDVVNLGSENWLDEMCDRSLNLSIRANGFAMPARLSH